MKKENFVIQLNEFLESKGLTKEEAHDYLIEVFTKAFEKDKDALSRYEEEEPEPVKITTEIDMETGLLKIEKLLDVVEEKTIISRFCQIELGDERLEGTGLKEGDVFTEYINLEDIKMGKRQHIKQLFLQKLSESEKTKVYDKFIKFQGELLNAKIHKVLDKGNVILDINGDSIFMPSTEIPSLDRDKIVEGKPLTIYVLEIKEIAKDAQIIASRKNPNFVTKLIEREIDDVGDGVVQIEAVSREAGFKTKVAVSTTIEEVDPVGSIIGVKGQRIKAIVDEIGGERLDIIKYHDDIKQFIAEALLPAEISGIKVTENEDGWREAVVVVEEDQFLPAIGKRGINIKLAAILTKSKLDVKTVAEAKEQGIDYDKISKSKFISQNNNSFNDEMDFQEFTSIEEMAEEISSMAFTADDYAIDNIYPTEEEIEEQLLEKDEHEELSVHDEEDEEYDRQ